jgi:branched-subunit amino acid transport protein AzlD
MTQLSRWLARYELVRTAATWLAVSVLAILAAYVFAALYVKPTPGGIAAAVALVAVAGSGLLYAFRPGTGGPGD